MKVAGVKWQHAIPGSLLPDLFDFPEAHQENNTLAGLR